MGRDALAVGLRQESGKSFMMWLSRRIGQGWLAWFVIPYGILVGLPWLAPSLMKLEWSGPAKAIYLVYSFLYHQLPQRSFTLFGSQMSYELGQIQGALPEVTGFLGLRQFVGNLELGYKVAWSDRMAAIFTSILITGLIWRALRRRGLPLPLRAFVVLSIPMAIDGTSHFISDLSGLGQGFRYANQWLVTLTASRLPPSFYAGNALGSFNSWLRLITGALFGISVVWSAFPFLESAIAESIPRVELNPIERVGSR